MESPTYLEWMQQVSALLILGFMVPALAWAAGKLTPNVRFQQWLWRFAFVALLLGFAGELTGVLRVSDGKIERSHDHTLNWKIAYPESESSKALAVSELPVAVPANASPSAETSSWLSERSWAPGVMMTVGVVFLLLYFFGLRVALSLYLRRTGRLCSGERATACEQVLSRLGYRRPCEVREGSGDLGPLVLGLWRPMILLPNRFFEDFSDEERDLVLAHEVAHLCHRDPFWKLWSDLVTALFWWHPLVWWARKQSLLCDEFAADGRAAATERGPESLAACLVKFGRVLETRSQGVALVAGGSAFGSRLGRRVQQLLKGSGEYQELSWGRVGFVGGMVLSLSLGGYVLASETVVSERPRGLVVGQPSALVSGSPESQQQPEEQRSAGAVNLGEVSGSDVEGSAQAASQELVPPSGPVASEGEVSTEASEQRESPEAPVGVEGTDELLVRSYRLDPVRVEEVLNQMLGEAPSDETVLSRLVSLLDSLGLKFPNLGEEPTENKRSIYFNQENGALLVRATLEEQNNIVAQAVGLLSSAPEQLVLMVRLAEIPQSMIEELRGDFPGILDLEAAEDDDQSGILSAESFRALRAALQNRGGVGVLAAPSVTTLSGREASVEATDVVSVVVSSEKATESSESDEVMTKEVKVGTFVRLLPSVAPGSEEISLDVSFLLREFLGYDDPGQIVIDGKPVTGKGGGALPLPRFRERAGAASRVINDGETLVLMGMPAEDVRKIKTKTPLLGDLPILGRMFRREYVDKTESQLMVFVTGMVIDPAGNRKYGKKSP